MSQLLRKCAEAERNLAKAYDLMADKFKSENEIFELFKKMAHDEEEHARKIDFAVRLDTVESGILDDSGLDKSVVERLHNSSLELLETAQGQIETSIAADLAMSMEGEFRLLHLEAAASIKAPQLKTLFKALSRGDDEHFATLKQIISALSQY